MNIRKSTALLLALVMVLSMLPVSAMAIGNDDILTLAEGWELLRGDNKAVIDAPGQVSITTQYGNFDKGGMTPKNILLYDVEGEDFEVSVKLHFKPTANFNTAGIVAYKSDSELLGFVRRHHTYFETKSLCTMGLDGDYSAKMEETHELDPSQSHEDIWLKITKEGTKLQCFYSLDGESWSQHDSDFTFESFSEGSDMKVGIYTGDTSSNSSVTATFTEFTVNGEEIDFAAYKNPVTGVSVDTEAVELVPGQTAAVTAEVSPADASLADVIWTSSDEEVATVDGGVITAVAPGEATVTVTTVDGGFTAEVDVTVTDVSVHVDSVTLDKTSATLELDETLQLTATVKPANATIQDIIWTSSNSGVASVDENGLVTALYKGTATITATSSEGGKTAECVVTVNGLSEETQWEASSPDGNVTMSLWLDDAGKLHYSAVKGEAVIAEDSHIGMVSDLADFTSGLLFVESSELEKVDYEYEMVSGKNSLVRNLYNTVSLTFRKGPAKFIVELRLYNDGYAFRHTIEKLDGTTGTLVISDETSTFDLPAGTNTYVLYNNTSGTAFNHESGWDVDVVENLQDRQISLPMMAENKESGLWTLITEANLYGDVYVGSFLHHEGDGELKMTIPLQQGTKMGTMEVTTEYPFTTPWRLAVAGTLENIIETDMIVNCADESTVEDMSWIKPGVTTWGWLAGTLKSQHDFEGIKKIVDLAAEMEWSYYILDEGWQPYNPNYVFDPLNPDPNNRKYIGYYDGFDELVEYAEERGVGMIAWILAHDLDTPAELAILEDFAAHGIKGIKVDFFDYDDQETTALYEVIYKECARLGLIINAHGANKPTGEARTYPNVINREAVPGEEYGGHYNTDMTTIWPFIRGVVGPMDITPKVFPNGTGTTTGHNVAMLITCESGMPCMASNHNDYRQSASYTLLKGLPAAWDETQFVDGYPGDYYIVARRSGENWYVGAQNDKNAREAVIPMDFLPEGETYTAMIYFDGQGRNDMLVDFSIVDSTRTLTVPMASNGGCCVKLVPYVEDSALTEVTADEELRIAAGDTAAIGVEANIDIENSDIAWTISDSSVATVNAYGEVEGIGPGVAVVTGIPIANPELFFKTVIMVTGEKYVPAGTWEVKNPASKASEQTITYESDPTKITLPILTGDFGGNGNARNVWVMDAPEGDFVITVKIPGGLTENFQTVALTAYADNINAVSMTRRFHSWLGNNIFCMWNWDNGYSEHTATDTKHTADAWMKLERKGNVFTGSFSYDGQTWTTIDKTITSAKVGECEDLKVGVYAVSGTYGANIPVTYENFTLNGEVKPFIELKTVQDVALVKNPDAISVEAGTAFEALDLPEEVTVYLDSGDKAVVPVKWNAEDYNAAVPGTQIITGELDLSGVEKGGNANGILAEAEITVEEEPFVNPFTDVKEGDWYYDSVMWAVKNQITSGATETTFDYDGLSERCQVVTFLWRAAGEPEPETTENPFTDVNEGHYFYKAVLWAYEKGITQGISDTEFGPFAKCTRGQVVTFLHRVEGTPESSFVNSFEDVNETHYFYDAVLWAAENGITVGRTDTTFDPEGQCKRSEIVTFLYRCMGK